MFTWGYFLEHPEFLSLLGTENLHRARWLRQSTRLKELHSSFIDKLSDLLQRGKAGGLFRPDVDPLNLYLTIAALGYFYLSNQYTLSTIFGRDLMDKSNLDVWQRHIVHAAGIDPALIQAHVVFFVDKCDSPLPQSNRLVTGLGGLVLPLTGLSGRNGMPRLGIILHGVTGRMGYNQHLVRSILAIRDRGGITLQSGERLEIDPIIVGRNRDKMEQLAKRHDIARWSTDLDAALADPNDQIFFDAGTTLMRAELIGRALDAGKHVYCEKPISDDLKTAVKLARKARASGLKHGVVQDKLFLPGLRKLALLRIQASSARYSRCVASSATGCSKAIGAFRPSGPHGTTGKRTAAASSSTCSATGATCSTISSGK